MSENVQNPQSFDRFMINLVSWLVQQEAVHPDTTFDAERFRLFKSGLRGQIEVPRTTITPIMERMLFATVSSKQVRNVVVLGSFYGYALLWLAGGILEKENAHVTGFDIDKEVCEIARMNAVCAGVNVEIIVQDAYQGIERFEEHSVDLLLIDVERNRSKADYAELLDSWYTKMRPGGIILAHDPVVELFAQDFELYHAKLEDSSRYRLNITLKIDECGLDVTRVV